MNDKVLNYQILVQAQTDAAKASLIDLRREAGLGSSATDVSATASKNHATALKSEADAASRVAAETKRLADQEKRLRDEALKVSGVPTPRPSQAPRSPTKPQQFGPEIPDQIRKMRAQYVPLIDVQQKYTVELNKLQTAHKMGAIDAAEYAAALSRLDAARQRQVTALGMVNPALKTGHRQMKLNTHQAQNLSFQLNDLFQTIALGMPIQQVLLQQGPQITQIYGGVGNTLRALRSALSPLRLALGATTAIVGTGALAWAGYRRSITDVEAAAAGIGRATAGTAAGMEAAALAGAASARITIKEARTMQAQFLRTGKIGSESFEQLIGMSQDFAVTLGISTTEAGKTLSDMFADPAQAADTLLNKYGLIDAATARHARNLAAQNRQSEAQAVLIDALPGRLASATEATTELGRAWGAAKAAASGAMDSIGGAIDRALEGTGIDARIAAQELMVRRTARRLYVPGNRKLLEEQKAELARMRAERDAEAKKEETAERDKAREAEKRKGAFALGIANESPAINRALKRETLTNEIAGLEAGIGAPGLDEEQQQRIATSIEAKKNALAGLADVQQRAIQLDRLAIQIQNEQNPLIRAELEARRTRLEMADEEVTSEKAANEAARARARVMAEASASAAADARNMRLESDIRSRLGDLVAKGALTTEQANRQLEQELRLRPLIAAAALAEGEEKAKLLDVIEQLKGGYEALEGQRAKAAAQDYLRSQQQTIDQLKTEIALVGASAQHRARILELQKAEQEIQRQGIDRNGAMAGQIRAKAGVIADQTRELEKLSEAWDRVRTSAESAIDTITDDLLKGDISGALESLASEFAGLVTDLAIKNPLKNAALGTDYATLDSVGGFNGILGRLLGDKTPAVDASVNRAQNASTMTVEAKTVILNGALSFAAGSAGSAANYNGGIAGAGGLTGGKDVQQQVWDFFSAKGLAPHQVAGIMGNVNAESGFNPLATGDGGSAHGLFQHNDRAPELFKHLGGRQNLGDVKGQLEFAWKELMTSEAKSMARLRNASNVREATSAFVGFERPQGYSIDNPEGALHYDRRLGAAQAAMTTFTRATAKASENVVELGNGADAVGQVLGSIDIGKTLGNVIGGGGQKGSLIGTVLTGIGGALGIPGFAAGSYTGGSDPSKIAGFVHEQEFVFDAAATRRIGVTNLEAIRKGNMGGFRHGGYTMPPPIAPTGRSMPMSEAPVIILKDYSGEKITAKQEQTPQGGRQATITIGEQAARAIAQPGNPMGRQLQATYGLKKRGVGR